MSNLLLDKIVDQIKSEVVTDYNKRLVYLPFLKFPLGIHTYTCHMGDFKVYFPKHCKDVYSLNDKEIEYVWDKYVTPSYQFTETFNHPSPS
jgi:hypothetical protein